jgi:hypothetical protein
MNQNQDTQRLMSYFILHPSSFILANGFVRRILINCDPGDWVRLADFIGRSRAVTNSMEIIVAMIVPTSLVDRAFVPLGEIVDGFVHRNRARRPGPR